eukprot:CAMPEP_0170446820 /NCGR_PEP_ID=MMETSP0117_2-20130122/49819_1 /TAXON_ID=400756 /ORGANISM="Durinskia baltica, Strain CSIRO CS-38" /LENGTH=33 /DNA_ID= /DNA_START= /DNA_END= /DNA_ORIENTATION=
MTSAVDGFTAAAEYTRPMEESSDSAPCGGGPIS